MSECSLASSETVFQPTAMTIAMPTAYQFRWWFKTSCYILLFVFNVWLKFASSRVVSLWLYFWFNRMYQRNSVFADRFLSAFVINNLYFFVFDWIPVSVSHCGHYVVWTGQMFHTLQIPCMNLIHYAGICCGKLLTCTLHDI